MRRVWRTRAYGDFWSYMLLAEGAVDIAAEPELAVHDMAALDVIVREAGGMFTSLDGDGRPVGRQRAGHQRPPARRGAVVPGLDGRRRRRPGLAADRPRFGLRAAAPRAAAGRRPGPRGPDPTRSRVLNDPVQQPVGSLPSRYQQFREVAMQIVEVLKAKPERGVVTITPDAGVRELIALLAEHNVGALIVSSDGETVDGIVSERDVVRHLHNDGTVVNNTVGAIMTEVVETCAPDTTLDDLMEIMTRPPDPPRAGRQRTASSSASSRSATWSSTR